MVNGRADKVVSTKSFADRLDFTFWSVYIWSLYLLITKWVDIHFLKSKGSLRDS